jgi:CheY-like chemotaxis protein
MNTEKTELKNILLIEDDLQDVELTLTALEEHHLANRVAVVCDGAEALDYLYQRGKFKMRGGGDPIVVLLDNKMPKVSGLEVLKAMKADERLRIIPVVALTSSRQGPDLIEFYKHGVNAYVVKPVDFSQFTEVVKRLGIFWAFVNEPPPLTRMKDTPIQNNDVPAPYPALEAAE